MNSEGNGSRQSEGGQHVSATLLTKLPSDMVVTLDGNSSLTRRPIGELVTQALGAVLIDSERYHRSLAMSCVEAGIDLEDESAVLKHCGRARIDIWVKNETEKFEEALVFVNGDLFNEKELKSIPDDTPKEAFAPVARDMVTYALHKLPARRRAVVLGYDMGSRVFKLTPFKFFVSSPMDAGISPKSRNLEEFPDFDALPYKTLHRHEMALIDGISLSANEACTTILEELIQQHQRHQAKGKVF